MFVLGKDKENIIAEAKTGEELKKQALPDFFHAIRRKISERIKSLPNDLTPVFIKVSFAVSAAVIIGVTAAAFFIPKSGAALRHGLNILRTSDSAYLTAKASYDDASDENSHLSEELNTKANELEEFRTAKDNLDRIAESNRELQETRDSLLKEAEEKQREHDSLTEELGKKVTLPSGYYTVGKDIAAGKYTVTGSGSIAVAHSGRSTANKPLTSQGEEFEFRPDDIIQIDGNAKFIPREDK